MPSSIRKSLNELLITLDDTTGAHAALEEQYLDVLERTVQARPLEACPGGNPSFANRVRTFLLVRYYRGGGWQDRIEVGSD
jgi:nuclear pore complex protein Nup93